MKPLTDPQWKEINKDVNLPQTARKEIDNIIDIYNRFSTSKPRPSDVGKQLEDIASGARTLSQQLHFVSSVKDPFEQVLLMAFLTDDQPPSTMRFPKRRPDMVDKLHEIKSAVEALEIWADAAAKRLKSGSPGAVVSAGNNKWLADQLLYIYPDSQRIRRNPLPNGAIRILPSE